MKKLTPVLTFCFVAILALTLTQHADAQQRGNESPRVSPNAAVGQTIGTTEVYLTYGRPGLKGRDLSSLAPAGQVWRTGANESVAITFSSGVTVGDKEVPAGTYSLYTIPGEDEWTIIINEKLSWGTSYDESQDVIRTTASVSELAEPMEWFTIYFDNLSETKAHLNFAWGTVNAAVPISVE